MGGILSDKNIIISSDTKREKRVPQGQKITEGFPVLHDGSVYRIDSKKWFLEIFGLVEEPKKIFYNDFIALSLTKVKSDIHCVTGWSKLDNIWEGVSAITIKKLIKILPNAKFVLIHATGNFTANLPIEDFFQPDVIFAIKHNGELINAEHGGPVRLVVPKLYFWKSAKWVTGIEFIEKNKPGFWEKHGYHMRGDPWKEERYGSWLNR